MELVTEKVFNEKYDKGVVLVDFFATWCGPCKMITPVLEELSKEMANVTFLKVNVDEEGALASKYEVMSIPTLLLLKDGVKVDKVMGFQPKPALEAFIKKAL